MKQDVTITLPSARGNAAPGLTGWGQRLRKEIDPAGEADNNVDVVLSKPPQLDDLRAALAQFS